MLYTIFCQLYESTLCKKYKKGSKTIFKNQLTN